MLAQCAQQKKRPSASTPWPITFTPQYSHTGARAWMAHSKLSKVRAPSLGILTWKALSYSLPQTSHWAISTILSLNGSIPPFLMVATPTPLGTNVEQTMPLGPYTLSVGGSGPILAGKPRGAQEGCSRS